MSTRVVSGVRSVLIALSVSFAAHAVTAAPTSSDYAAPITLGACFFNDHMGVARCVDSLKSEECRKFPASTWKQAETCAHHSKVDTRTDAAAEARAHSVGRVTLTAAYVYGAPMKASSTSTVKVGTEEIPFSIDGDIYFYPSHVEGMSVPFQSVYHAEAYLYDNFCKSITIPPVTRYFMGYKYDPFYSEAYFSPLPKGSPSEARFVYGIVTSDEAIWDYYAYVFCDNR